MGFFFSKEEGKYLACVPIKEKIKVEEPFKIKILPSEKVAVFMHKKDSGSLDDSFEKVFAYLKRKNLDWRFPVREIYYARKEGYDIEIQVPVVE